MQQQLLKQAISEFPRGLCIKTRLSSQHLIWKRFFSLMQVKLIFTRKVVCTWPHFESEGFWNTEVTYWLLRFSCLVFQIQKLGILTGSNQAFCKYYCAYGKEGLFASIKCQEFLLSGSPIFQFNFCSRNLLNFQRGKV